MARPDLDDYDDLEWFDAEDFGGDLEAEDFDEEDFGDDLNPEILSDVLRQALHDDYAEASAEDMDSALANIMESMSPAESFNFAGALNQIGKRTGQVMSDPTLAQIARTALPLGGGALGTVIGGPMGTALGSQLGNVAAGALPVRAPVAPPAPQARAMPRAAATQPVRPSPRSPVVGGSAAAAQGLILTQQPDVLQSLLAAALGQHGQQQLNGIPVAQMLGMLSGVFGQAAADADELMYLAADGEAGEGAHESAPGSDRSLYTSLLGVDNIELSEALDLDGKDPW